MDWECRENNSEKNLEVSAKENFMHHGMKL